MFQFTVNQFDRFHLINSLLALNKLFEFLSNPNTHNFVHFDLVLIITRDSQKVF